MQRSIQRLFKLAKMGQKDEFNDALKTTNILNKLQYLNGKEASMLIYSFKRLRLMDHELQSQLEQLYLDSNYKMNIHDHVMCLWSLKNTENQMVKQAFMNSVKQNWFQVQEMQQSKANIGLIAYLAAQENQGSDPIWNQIERIFEETMEYQDERNFMTVLYSYSKIQSQSKSIWILLEKYIWGKGFNQFTNRNKVLMVYSFAKANKGSIQFWEGAAKYLQQHHFKYPDDIQFCIWSFAKVKFYDFEFWNSILDKQLFIWDKVSLSDIENTTWALESLQLNESEKLWQKILVKDISKHNTNSQKYNNFDELLTIGKRLNDLKFDDSMLFRSAKVLIKSMLINPDCDLTSIKRLYYLAYYLQRESPEFCLSVVRKLIQILQNQNDAFNLFFFNNVVMLAQDLKLEDKTIYEQLSQLFQNIKLQKKKQQNSELIAYFWAGSNLLQYEESQILPKLIDDCAFENANNNVVHLCNMIKILSQYNNTQSFFLKFKNYDHPKPDIFINLFLNMLHKYKYLIPSESYKQVIGMLKSAYQSQNKMIYQNKVIDLINVQTQNLIEELNKLFEIEKMQDLIKKYDGAIEVYFNSILD